MSTQGYEDSVPISEKVRFWEEQDKINQELIPVSFASTNCSHATSASTSPCLRWSLTPSTTR